MIESLALIFLVGLLAGYLCSKIKIPTIIGMLISGIILGPYCLNLLDNSILNISGELRKIALIIILIKAGLALDLNDLKKVGKPAILLSFLPASFELIGYIIFAPMILGIPKMDAAIMGAVLAAVSPAVVVPRMVNMIENNYGTKKGIPQMILAGASCDDVFVIVLFTTFIGMAQGKSAQLIDFINIPISIVLGVVLGICAGYFLSIIFEKTYIRENTIRNSIKVIMILGTAFSLITVEEMLKNKIAISGLLAVMSMATILRVKTPKVVYKRLSEKFGKLWLAAEVWLFVLVGAEVNIQYTLSAGTKVILMIFIALIFRSIAVFLSTYRTNLIFKERIFAVISYLPKATVQAAIGAIPLSLGLSCGSIVLSVAVIGIVITAPLGAFGIDYSYKKLLQIDEK